MGRSWSWSGRIYWYGSTHRQRDRTLRLAGPGSRHGSGVGQRGAGPPGRRATDKCRRADRGRPRIAARSVEGGKSQAGRSIAGGDGNGTLALITTAGPAQWLYLIDTKKRAFALYRIDPTNTKGIVKLEASRQYKWDLKLEHYNNQAPEPDAIKATVETLGRSDSINGDRRRDGSRSPFHES